LQWDRLKILDYICRVWLVKQRWMTLPRRSPPFLGRQMQKHLRVAYVCLGHVNFGGHRRPLLSNSVGQIALISATRKYQCEQYTVGILSDSGIPEDSSTRVPNTTNRTMFRLHIHH